MDEKAEIKDVREIAIELVSTLHEEGVPSYFIGCTSADGRDFAFCSQGQVGELISKALEVLFQDDPETVRIQITRLLKNVAEWYDFDDRISKTIH